VTKNRTGGKETGSSGIACGLAGACLVGDDGGNQNAVKEIGAG